MKRGPTKKKATGSGTGITDGTRLKPGDEQRRRTGSDVWNAGGGKVNESSVRGLAG